MKQKLADGKWTITSPHSPAALPASPSSQRPPDVSARLRGERLCRGCRPSLAKMIHERRRETAQKSEAARRALDWKAECMGSCSMPFKTSPTQQSLAFQRLQQMAQESSRLRSASGSSSPARSWRLSHTKSQRHEVEQQSVHSILCAFVPLCEHCRQHGCYL